MRNKTKLVYGVGVNDADYVVDTKTESGRLTCPFYKKWKAMLERCYSESNLRRHPSYSGCAVCTKWLTFSNFKLWMETQDWQGKELDKDIIGDGYLYSPEYCCFVSRDLNNFLTDSNAKRGSTMIGVSFYKRSGKYDAMIRNPFTKKLEHLGSHIDEDSAHRAWLLRKHEIACQLADIQSDERVANALRNKFIERIRQEVE
jgi:hypothetical protein